MVRLFYDEAYLAGHQQINARNRKQFFAVAATTMRRVLVDYARARKEVTRDLDL